MIENSRVEELTTLEMALEAYHKDNFFSIKRNLLGSEFDEGVQTEIWKDYHDLMYKAASSGFEEGDFERLESYRNLVSYWELVSDETRLFFPTEITRDESGMIIRVSLDSLDNEITKRLFEHVHNILIGLEVVRECPAEDCLNLFLQNRRTRKFCSEECRNRDWRNKNRQ